MEDTHTHTHTHTQTHTHTHTHTVHRSLCGLLAAINQSVFAHGSDFAAADDLAVYTLSAHPAESWRSRALINAARCRDITCTLTHMYSINPVTHLWERAHRDIFRLTFSHAAFNRAVKWQAALSCTVLYVVQSSERNTEHYICALSLFSTLYSHGEIIAKPDRSPSFVPPRSRPPTADFTRGP